MKISNKDRKTHVYDVEVEGDYPFEVQGYKALPVMEGEVLSIPVRVAVKRKQFDAKKVDVRFRVTARENPQLTSTSTTTFIGP